MVEFVYHIPYRLSCEYIDHTVDGSEIRRSLVDMANIPIISRDFYIPGGCWGFLPSAV